MRKRRLFIVAGDPSGDRHAADLLRQWLTIDPQWELAYWGGEEMESVVGFPPKVSLKSLSVMGFVEVIKKLPQLMGLLHQAKKDILQFEPEVLLLVDYQVFNAKLAQYFTEKGFRKKGLRVVQFIAPTAWAWKKNRVLGLRKNVDVLIPILPFEEAFFRQEGLENILYEGHPLADRHFDRNPEVQNSRPLVALLPGSREQEVAALLPLMVAVAHRMPSADFFIAAVPNVSRHLYAQTGLPFALGEFDSLMKRANAAIVASGTATLETALWGVPQTVVYRMHPVSFLLAKWFIQVPYVSLVNLILQRSAVPERLQKEANEDQMLSDLEALLYDIPFRKTQEDNAALLKERLGQPGVMHRLAKRLLSWTKTGALSLLGLSFWMAGGEKAQAQTHISVRQYSTVVPASLEVRALQGDWDIVVQSGLFSSFDTVHLAVGSDRLVYKISRVGDQVHLSLQGQVMAKGGVLLFFPHGHGSTVDYPDHRLGLRYTGRERAISGSLSLVARGSGLLPVARIPLEDYVAGVVEAEGGTLPEPAYYAAQAILVRTWALKNYKKHASEGYHVKDDVTSQVFHGLPSGIHSAEIWDAVRQTQDTVLVDKQNQLVEGVFHANSGGYTAAAQHVWSRPFSYLVAVEDTFSLRCPQTTWTKRIDKEAFVRFFAEKMGFSSTNDSFRAVVFSISQRERNPFFTYGGKTLKLRWVREKFGLRSTFFTVTEGGSEVTLQGKGFGHGVGLSQEGAFRMAQFGYNPRAILAHYFPGTQWENRRLLPTIGTE